MRQDKKIVTITRKIALVSENIMGELIAFLFLDKRYFC